LSYFANNAKDKNTDNSAETEIFDKIFRLKR